MNDTIISGISYHNDKYMEGKTYTDDNIDEILSNSNFNLTPDIVLGPHHMQVEVYFRKDGKDSPRPGHSRVDYLAMISTISGYHLIDIPDFKTLMAWLTSIEPFVSMLLETDRQT